MQPCNPFQILGEQTETETGVEAQDVCTGVKRRVETWRGEPIPDSIIQKYDNGDLDIHAWPDTNGVTYKQVLYCIVFAARSYKQVVKNYWEAHRAVAKDVRIASLELIRRGEWLDKALRETTRLEQGIEEMMKAFLRSEAEKKEAKAKLLRSEVAREKAEVEWKTLVEQRDKWRREAEKTAKEKDKMVKDLRHELRAAKLAARRAPTTTTATQTTPPATCSTTTQTTETKPTYASMATQADADSRKRDKGKGKVGQPAPTAATSTSVAGDIVMKDWSPYEDLSEYEKEAEVVVPRGAPTRTVRKHPTVTPAAPPAVTKPTGNATNHRALVVHGISCQQPIAVTILDARRWGNVLGARWLLGKSRREGKTTSSVVVFFDREVQVGPSMKIRGNRHSVEAYDWDRGRR